MYWDEEGMSSLNSASPRHWPVQVAEEYEIPPEFRIPPPSGRVNDGGKHWAREQFGAGGRGVKVVVVTWY